MSAPSFKSFAAFPAPQSSEPGAKQPTRSTHSNNDDHSRKRSNKKGSESRKRNRSNDRDAESRHRDPDKNRHRRDKHSSKDKDKDKKHTRYDETPFQEPSSNSVLFWSDRKGDPSNVTYGGVHKGDVPRYYHFAGGRAVLGLEGGLKVASRSQHTIELAQRKGKEPQITDSSAYRKLTNDISRKLVSNSKALARYGEIDGFIPIAFSKDSAAQPYREIAPEDSSHSDSTSDHESRSDDESDTEVFRPGEVVRDLEQKLQAAPDSAEAWLDLLQHSLQQVPLNSPRAATARADVSLSVISRAFKAHTRNRQSTQLWLKYLAGGKQVWHSDKLQDSWDEALNSTGSPDIWMEWLDQRLRSCRSVDDLTDITTEAIQKMPQRDDPEEVDAMYLRCQWRIITFLKDAGFVERGVAVLQAQAEFLFQRPQSLIGFGFSRQLDKLEEFWESEVPRMGENSAQGWSSWSADQGPEPSEKHVPPPDAAGIRDPYALWCSREQYQDEQHQLPSRSIDDNDDPYATILFSDIRTFLFPIRSSRGMQFFRLVFLHFLSLPVPGLSAALSPSSLDERWCLKHLSNTDFISRLFPSSRSDRSAAPESVAGVLVGKEKTYQDSFTGVKEWGFNVREPLDAVHRHGEDRMWDRFSGDVNMIRNLFQHLHIPGEDQQWNILSVAFEAALNVKDACQASKRLLSVNQHSHELWLVHARLERMRMRSEQARKTYRTVLSSSANQPDAARVWCEHAEHEWLCGNSEEALAVVLAACGQAASSGRVGILRSKARLEDQARASTPWRTRQAWIRLRILLELLTGTVQVAIEVLRQFTNIMTPGHADHESLLVAALIMVYHHRKTLKNHFPPAILRAEVQAGFNTYPRNSILLGLFLECEKGEAVWGRIRAVLSDDGPGAHRDKCLSRRVSEVWVGNWERGRWEGEQERIRAGLEAAVLSEWTQGSPILWRIFVEFELRTGDLQRAKRVLLRALGECPMVKELYLLAFGSLRSVFPARELNGLAEAMAERGIRMRGSLEDYLVGYRELAMKEKDINDNEDLDEVEHIAKEQRRLMPY